jgi:hypothetical protein
VTETPRASPVEKSEAESQTQIFVVAARAAEAAAAIARREAPKERRTFFTTFSA